MSTRNGLAWVGAVVVGAAIVQVPSRLEMPVAAQSHQVQAPRFEVDAYWPKPLPNNALWGFVIGVAPDAQNNIWILQHPDKADRQFTAAKTDSPANSLPNANRAELADKWVRSAIWPDGRCCSPYPHYILQLNQAGNVINKFADGSDYGLDWLFFPHGLTIDHKGNIWTTGNSVEDSRVLKFSKDMKLLKAFGTRGAKPNSNDPNAMGAPAAVVVDPETNEVFIADGNNNRRILVLDADTGAYKRHWGAYGNKPDDSAERERFNPTGPPPKQFSGPHCIEMSRDGFIYVCDWNNNRVQVFRKNGTFVKELIHSKDARELAGGSVWALALSRDPQQRYLYVANTVNRRIDVLQRDTLEVLYSFGSGGLAPGQIYTRVHNMNTDLQGNLYITESGTGARIQKFVFKGVGPVTKGSHETVLWPQSRPTQ